MQLIPRQRISPPGLRRVSYAESAWATCPKLKVWRAISCSSESFSAKYGERDAM
jgi:hypothetical protein